MKRVLSRNQCCNVHYISELQEADLDNSNSKISFTIKKPYVQCSKCLNQIYLTSVSVVSLSDHLVQEHQIPVYACNWCSNISEDSMSLQHHMLTEHGRNIDGIVLDEEVFQQEYSIEPHSNMCILCRKVYLGHVDLREHISQHLEEGGLLNAHRIDPVETDTDAKPTNVFEEQVRERKTSGLKSKISLEEHDTKDNPHRHILNNPNNEKSFNCSDCGGKFKSGKSLREHVKFKHEQKWTHICDWCGKGVRTKPQLFHHIRLHHSAGETCHQCKLCSFTSASETSLRRHMNNVHKEKHSICPICSQKIKNKQSLKRHVQIVHGVKGKDFQTLVCSICGKEFREKSSLTKHIKESHSNSSCQFVCDVCGKTFKRKFGLTQHSILHQEDTPYRCSICEKGFKYSTNYYNHMQTKHNVFVPRKKLARQNTEARS